MHTESHTPPKAVFVSALIVIFCASLSAADSIGLVPCYLDETCTVASDSIALSNLPMLGDTQSDASSTLPVHITISSVGIDLPVQNPSTRDIETLDALLTSGPARYVDSAKLGESGNVLIFAHSSHLPIVHNQMFKAFNDIPNVQKGDVVSLTGEDGTTYLYAVDSVEKADADSAIVDLSPEQGKKLTLVTCDTLTGKSARFILTATFVGTL